MAVRTSSVPEGTYTLSFIQGSFKKTTSVQLPIADNTPEAFGNAPGSKYSIPAEPWPAPFDTTTHKLHLGDARNLSWIPDESVHLVVTSPPYWTLKEYNHTAGQMGHIESYEHFLDERDTVWAECHRVLVPGGRICCVVGDVCGKPYQPGAVVKNDIEYILFLRKAGGYRSVSPIQKALSMLTKDEMQSWFLSFWTDIKGASTRSGFPGQQC